MRILPEYRYPQTPPDGGFAWCVALQTPIEAFDSPPPRAPEHISLEWSLPTDPVSIELESWVAAAANWGACGLTLKLVDAPRRPYAELLETLRSTLVPAAWAASEVGLRLTFDRGRSRLLLSPLEAAELVDRVNAPGFGLALGCGATVAIGDPADWIHALAWRLAALRADDGLSENLDESARRPFRQGDVDWPTVAAALRAIRYDGPLLASPDEAPHVREVFANVGPACPENSPTGPTG